MFASILRGPFAAVTPSSGLSLTIAGTAGAWTLTRSAGSYLTDGIKIGDVVRITAGTYANAVNRDNNIVVTGVTALVITGATMNASVLIAEGPIATSTVTVVGKKIAAPVTGHTSEYWTVEEFQSDITQSELFTDVVFGSVDVDIPATGNTKVAFSAIGRDRTSSGAQVLTTPTAETTTAVVQGIKGFVMVNGAAAASITSAKVKIDGGVQAMDNVLGSNIAPDVARGILKVSGSITAFYQDGVLPGLFDAATPINLILIDAVDGTNTSEFVSFVMSKVIFDSDDKDSSMKGVIRTYNFTAQINGSGGAALANSQTILSTQDSLAA